MQSRNLLIGLLVGTIWVSAVAAPKVQVGPKMLQEGGDCLGDEILAWQRLRAERRVVIEQDDSPPMACVDEAGRVYLVTGTGKYLISDDGGQNFAPAVQIVVEDHVIKNVQALGVLRSTAPRRLWLGRSRGPVLIAYGAGGRLFLARSENDGQSWDAVGELKASGYDQVRAGGVRICQLKDGQLLLAVSAGKTDNHELEGLVYASKDEGRSWSKMGDLGPRCAGANLLQLQSGELLAAMTYQGGRHQGDPGTDIPREELFNNVVVAHSRDGGKTWKDFQFVTRYHESPADLAELPDGTVVLTYGQQNFPYGARALTSKDGGQTWDHRIYILGYSTFQMPWSSAPRLTEPGWRVATVPLTNGIILSFYTRGSFMVNEAPDEFKQKIGEMGKSILSVRWLPDGMEKPPLGIPLGMRIVAKQDSNGYLNNGRILINPEHLNWGGDYFANDEILAYERVAAEHYVVGLGAGAIVSLDPEGNPVVAMGDGQVYRSTDKGRQWKLLGQIPQSDGGGGVQSFGVLRDGTMLVATCVSSPRDATPENPAPARVDVFRSEDGGRTWSAPIRVDPSPFDYMGSGNCMRITQLGDGTAIMTTGNLYQTGHKTDLPWDAVFRSRDGGKTWGDMSYIGHPACETNVIQLKSGRLMAAIRAQGVPQTDDFLLMDAKSHRSLLVRCTAVSFSEDDGYTWSPMQTVTRYNAIPGDLAQLPDGTIVLTYHLKDHPPGARAMISQDEGKTWEKTCYMLNWWVNSGGHTSSVVLRDGRVLTLENGASPGDNSLVTEAVIWKPLPAR